MSQTYEDKLTLEAWNGKLGRAELIRSATVAETASTYYLDVSDIDWGSWEYVVFALKTTWRDSAEISVRVKNSLDNDKSIYCSSSTDISCGPVGSGAIVFAPQHNAGNLIFGFYLGNKSGIFHSLKDDYTDIVRFYYFAPGGHIYANTIIEIWGIQ